MEIANLSVSITGDTSGLLSALGEAQNALAKFDSKTLTKVLFRSIRKARTAGLNIRPKSMI